MYLTRFKCNIFYKMNSLIIYYRQRCKIIVIYGEIKALDLQTWYRWKGYYMELWKSSWLVFFDIWLKVLIGEKDSKKDRSRVNVTRIELAKPFIHFSNWPLASIVLDMLTETELGLV